MAMMYCCCDAYTIAPVAVVRPSLTLSRASSTFNHQVKITKQYQSPTSLFVSETDADNGEEDSSSSSEVAGETSAASDTVRIEKRQSKWQSIWKKVRPTPEEKEKKMTTRERLAKMGLATLLSYGLVSNINSCITVGISWFAFSKKTQLSPLAPDQWKPFLAVYAGFYVASNFLRPFRVALSIGVGPYLDSFIRSIQKRTKVNKSVAVGITVFFFNIVITTTFMALCILSASVLAGVPPFAGKV